VLVESGGRVWPARLYLTPTPPLLRISAGNTQPISLELAGETRLLPPRGEVEIPWSLFAGMVDRGLVLGDPRSEQGALRIPTLGDTILFELTDRGLVAVGAPSSETVWALTRDPARSTQLRDYRLRDQGRLPPGWAILRRVPVANLGFTTADLEPAAHAPLSLEGGLAVDRQTFLTGSPPILVAGDVEGDALTVGVNGHPHGSLASGDRLRLPGGEPGTYRVDVGSGLFRTEYHIENRGARRDYAALKFNLAQGRSLKAGASGRADEGDGPVVCGALVDPSPDWPLPILVRRDAEHLTINSRGELARHARPPTPAWFRRVGLDRGGRWEIEDDDVVWLICPKWRHVRLWRDASVVGLSREAAEAVRALGTDVHLVARRGLNDAPDRWGSLRQLAEERAS
jgi:hypothetical protein